MKHNISSFDAAARIVLAFVIITVGHHLRSWWALAGFLPLLSGIAEVCPLYWIFGFNTCAQDDAEAAHAPRSSVKNV